MPATDTPNRTHALIGCGAQKRDTASAARDLYTSTYASKKMRLGQLVGEPNIISAEYGFLKPQTHIEPYDTHISDLDTEEFDTWRRSVGADIIAQHPEKLVVMLSQSYKHPLSDPLATCINNGATVIDVFEDTSGIGEQYARLDGAADGIEEDGDSIESYGVVFDSATALQEAYK